MAGEDEAGVNEIEQDKKRLCRLRHSLYRVSAMIQLSANKFKERDIWKIMRNFDPL